MSEINAPQPSQGNGGKVVTETKEPAAQQQEKPAAENKVTPAVKVENSTTTTNVQTVNKEQLPLDRRKWTTEQRLADDARKAQGKAIRENGKQFESDLKAKFCGTDSFVAKGKHNSREFDGSYIADSNNKVYYEAKSGGYWDMLLSSKEKLRDFRDDMLRGLEVARDNGATYEVHSNACIPCIVKDLLKSIGIKFTEWI